MEILDRIPTMGRLDKQSREAMERLPMLIEELFPGGEWCKLPVPQSMDRLRQYAYVATRWLGVADDSRGIACETSRGEMCSYLEPGVARDMSPRPQGYRTGMILLHPYLLRLEFPVLGILATTFAAVVAVMVERHRSRNHRRVDGRGNLFIKEFAPMLLDLFPEAAVSDAIEGVVFNRQANFSGIIEQLNHIDMIALGIHDQINNPGFEQMTRRWGAISFKEFSTRNPVTDPRYADATITAGDMLAELEKLVKADPHAALQQTRQAAEVLLRRMHELDEDVLEI